MKIAFYKNRKDTTSKVICWWTKGPYSHCEIIFNSGVSASSSGRDGGVRFKEIEFHPERWDIYDLGEKFSEEAAHEWFLNHEEAEYDHFGLVGFLYPPFDEDRVKYFCSEAVAAALGFEEPWRFDPNTLATVIKRFIV